ncbi:LOW QUALITY PROTEIN: focadhesin [Centruroides vittatus]|uniref:LOW QUALITY PROTEIN: focadhesin n=1 Tax=Centruroides vittatus TaxID=120091 RepID=UPI00351093FA
MSSINKLKAKKENFYRKLQFNNVSFQTRIITKIVDDLSKENVLDEQIPELAVLWDNCGDESPIIGKLCCKALTFLTIKGKLDPSKAIDEFNASIPSAKQVGPIIDAIGRILLFEAAEQERLNNRYECPYSFSSPVHPFISILREKQESWPFILQWIKHVLNNKEYPFRLAKPLLCYILLNPLQSCDDFFNINIHYELFSNIDNIKFIYSFLPLIQTKTKAELIKLTILIEKLSECTQYTTKVEKEMLLLITLSVCKDAIDYGFDITNIITVCKKLVVEKDISFYIKNVCIVFLSVIIDCVVDSDLYHILSFGELVLKLQNFRVQFDSDSPVDCKNNFSASILGMLILPILNVLSREYDDSMQNIKSIAAEIFLIIERTLACKFLNHNIEYWSNENEKCLLICSFNPLVSEIVNSVYFIVSLDEINNQEEWIDKISAFIKSSNCVQPLLLNILCNMFINVKQLSLFRKYLDVLKYVAVIEPSQSLSLLSLFLYKLNVEHDPNTQLIITESLPSLATHNYSIGVILNTIQYFINHHKLKPEGIHLMILLWKKQIRCFPYLKQLLEEEIKDSTNSSCDKVLVAKAAAMKEICETHPQNFGIFILKHMSDIFNKCTSDASSPAVALALNGIFYLCKAGEIDIKSAWKTLARKLTNDKRPLVLKHLYKLLSLAPELRVMSSSYEKFMTEVVSMLWKHVSKQNNAISISAAYEALGKFSIEFHHLKILPDVATRNIISPKASSPLDLGKDPLDRLGYVPGFCFTDLLESINDEDILKGYEEFLIGLLNFEIDDLPQSVYHSAKVAAKPSKRDNIINEIPQFLCMKYSSNRQPILQSNLALGILLSYHPPVEVDKYGLPTKQSLIAQSNYYQQILEALLQDITIDISEWWQCVLLSFAWSSFMDRAFFSCIEGMFASRELEKKDSNKNTETENRKEILTAVRENLLEIIKRQSKEKPSTPANAIMAVVGLAVSFWKYENTAKCYKLENSEEHHLEFILKITETMICILDPSRKPNSEVIGWLLVHGKKSGFGSSVLRGCTATSFFHLVPFLMGSGYDCIGIISDLLLEQLSPKANAVLQLHSGIGLGLFLQSVANVGQTEVCLKTIKRIEDIVKENEELMPGSIIGLSLSILSLYQSDDDSIKNYTQNIWQFYIHMLQKADPLSLSYDILCQCTVMLTVSAMHANIITFEQCKEFFLWIDNCHKEQSQSSGIAVSIGTFVGMLTNLGYEFVSEKRMQLLNNWMNIVSSEEKPNLQKLAALRGLSSLFTKFNHVCVFDLENETNIKEISEMIQLMMRLFKKPKDVVLQNTTSWLLGELYSISGGYISSSSLPTNYLYLHEKYLLRAIIGFISKSAKHQSLNNHLNVCLNVLSRKYSKPFPPISWTAVLNPLLQGNEDTINKCLKIFISQSSSSSTAALSLSTLTTPLKFNSLPIKCQQFLICSLPVLLKCLPATKLNSFFSSIIVPVFSTEKRLQEDGTMVLNALYEAISKNQNESINEILKDVITHIVNNSFEKHFDLFQHLNLTNIMCNCLMKFPSELLENVIKNVSALPATILCCELLKKDKLTLASLHFCIDLALYSNDQIRHKIIKKFLNFFIHQNIDIKENISKQKMAADWLLEIMNRIITTIKHSSTSDQIDFLLSIFACSILSYSGIQMTYMINFYDNKQSLLSVLPAVLPNILQTPIWNHLTAKIVDFFLLLETYEEINYYTKLQLLAILCSLRGFQEFAKTPVYSKVFSYLESFHLI